MPEHLVEEMDVTEEHHTRRRRRLCLSKKKFHFIKAFISLSALAFTSALDATILSIALPVS
jgi:hypothetical protein